MEKYINEEVTNHYISPFPFLPLKSPMYPIHLSFKFMASFCTNSYYIDVCFCVNKYIPVFLHALIYPDRSVQYYFYAYFQDRSVGIGQPICVIFPGKDTYCL